MLKSICLALAALGFVAGFWCSMLGVGPVKAYGASGNLSALALLLLWRIERWGARGQVHTIRDAGGKIEYPSDRAEEQ